MAKKPKVEILYRMETEFPLAGKDRVLSSKEWKRIYGYDVFFNTSAKFIPDEQPEKTT
jgi:hypothetical protein